MGKETPAPPDYTPFIQASQSAAAADSHAADLQFQTAQRALDQQDVYAQKAGSVADQYLQMSKDAAQWGRDQFNTVWPYAQRYMQDQTTTAEQQNAEAKQTYDRYVSTYAPREDQFTQEAFDWATPARQEQAAASAKADVASSFAATQEAANRTLQGYGVNPSEGRFAALQDVGAYQEAAAGAAAGTQARMQTELQGKTLEGAAIQIGQKLPTFSLGEVQAGTTAGSSGIGSANTSVGTGSAAYGSPTAYAGMSNPYTQLSGAYGTVGGNLYGTGTRALGDVSNALGVGVTGLNDSFSNQMSQYNAQVQQSQALWGGIGKLAGGIALAPVTGGGSLIGNRLG